MMHHYRPSRSRTSSAARHTRRGSIYIIVVGTSLLVSLLGLSSLLNRQVFRRTYQSTFDTVQARNNALSAIRVGMLLIKNDPDWRYTFPNGVWEQDTALAQGTYTLEGTDPTDSDLTDNPTEPVVLTGIGKYGDVTHRTRITLVLANRGFTCLEAAIHSDNDVKILNGATINNNQMVSANHNVEATTATVNSDAEAVNDITGDTYSGTNTIGITPRTMPDIDDVFAYYLAKGTVIDPASLPLGYSNVLKNPGFESGTTNWSSPGCVIAENTTSVHSGARSLLVTSRTNKDSGAAQDLTNILQNGTTYDVTAWIRVTSLFDVGMGLALKLDSTGGGLQWFYTSYTDARLFDGWVPLVKTLTPTWTGTLTSAELRIVSKAGDTVTSYYCDDVVLKETGNERTIHNQVLSPNSNPFGATNPLGIYIVDLAGSKLFIKNSRIVGTLVLIKPHAASAIGGGSALNWEAAVSGYPALLVDDEDVTINPSSAGLNESASQTNFNPTGTPYQGIADSDQTDTYPSEIKGLIYSTKKVILKNQPSITGAVIASDNVEIGGTLNLTWNPTYVTNPPPGFQGGDSVRILLDSAARPSVP